MDNFTENDADILDSILRLLIDNDRLTIDNLPLIKGYSPDYIPSDYDYYFNILSTYELVTGKISPVDLKPIKIKTSNFICAGGFKAVYNNSKRTKLRNDEIDRLSIEKLRNESWLIKMQKKFYWPILVFAIIGGLYSIYDISTKLLNDNKKKEQRTITKQELDKELTTLRTLILDNKKSDSLYYSNQVLPTSAKTKK